MTQRDLPMIVAMGSIAERLRSATTKFQVDMQQVFARGDEKFEPKQFLKAFKTVTAVWCVRARRAPPGSSTQR